jgi:hypothetical protein
MMCQGGAIGPSRRRTAAAAMPSAASASASAEPVGTVRQAASDRTRARRRCPAAQPLGPAVGPADPAAHRVGRYGQLGADRPVPLAAGAGQQRLADHVDRVGMARRGLGRQQHVRDGARRTPRPARPQRGTPATGQAERASPREAPLPQHTGAARTPQHGGSQIALRLGLVEHHDHALRLPASVDHPGRPDSREGASGVAAWRLERSAGKGPEVAVQQRSSSSSTQVSKLSHGTTSKVTTKASSPSMTRETPSSSSPSASLNTPRDAAGLQ